MKANQTVFQVVGAAALLGSVLTACDEDAPGGRAAAPVPVEGAVAEDPQVGKKITVRGLLRHFPQDVKSEEAWLGHEFMVGETPIRTTDAVPPEVLKKMVGETVEIEGLWNAGKKWEPPKPAEEEFYLQNPSHPEGVTVIRESGIEALSVIKVEE